jgi:hypothetical protein
MTCTESLRQFVNEMQAFNDEHIIYMNRVTGEFLGTTEEERAAGRRGRRRPPRLAARTPTESPRSRVLRRLARAPLRI